MYIGDASPVARKTSDGNHQMVDCFEDDYMITVALLPQPGLRLALPE